MRAIWKLGVPAATFVVAATLGTITLGVMTPGSATAGEYCRQDVSGHMTGCGYDTMQQCQDASSGIGGDCFRDPKLGSSNASNGSNAYAYQPNAPHATKRARNAAETRQ